MSLFRRLAYGRGLLDTQTMGVVVQVTGGGGFPPSPVLTYTGFNDKDSAGFGFSLDFGTLTDQTSNVFNGATISALFQLNTSTGSNTLNFTIAGNYPNDSRWRLMRVTNSTGTITDLLRTSATYTQDGGLTWSRWTWTATNPFGTNGTTAIITWY